MKADYYQTLGVPRDADAAAIKTAYRRLAQKHHPDKNPDNPEKAAEKFKPVQEAYAVLSDPQKKSAYDRFGHAAFEGGRGNGSAPPDFSGVFDDLFSDFFSGGGARGGGRRRILSIQLSFEESVAGCKKELRINEPSVCDSCGGSGGEAGQKMETCSACRGSGQIRVNRGFFAMQQTCEKCRGRGQIYQTPCPDCDGEGARRIARTVSVQIPAGIQDGESIRLNIPGIIDQFHLRVQVAPHPLFERDGDNLHISIPVSVVVAALGGRVESPLAAGGKVKITIPPETQSGAILRLRGRGAPNVRGGAPGDMLCHIAVETPVNLDEEQKNLLRKLDESLRKKHERHSPQERSWLDKARAFFGDE